MEIEEDIVRFIALKLLKIQNTRIGTRSVHSKNAENVTLFLQMFLFLVILSHARC